MACAARCSALTGFASLTYEIAWTRVLALTVGPTTYAFAATLTAFIGGLAIGSGVGAWIAGRDAPAFACAGRRACSRLPLSAAWSASLAGGRLPRLVAEQVAAAADAFGLMLSRSAMLVTALVLPAAIGLGAAFPLALATDRRRRDPTRRGASALVYAINTVAAVAGSLAAGFLLIPDARPAADAAARRRVILVAARWSSSLRRALGASARSPAFWRRWRSRR